MTSERAKILLSWTPYLEAVRDGKTVTFSKLATSTQPIALVVSSLDQAINFNKGGGGDGNIILVREVLPE